MARPIGSPTDLKKSFYNNFVEDENGCWVWAHNKNPGGYGKFIAAGEQLAHRVYYKWAHGPIPAGLVIDHMCRNRACVNPDHLRAVTLRENTLVNSNSYAGRNFSKTHCIRGHVLKDDGLGARRCDICIQDGRPAKYRKWLADPARYYRSLNCSTPEDAIEMAARRCGHRND